jgi:hypothetical protein
MVRIMRANLVHGLGLSAQHPGALSGADHTFQIAKHLRDAGVVSYQALFTVMNEHVQVVR